MRTWCVVEATAEEPFSSGPNRGTWYVLDFGTDRGRPDDEGCDRRTVTRRSSGKERPIGSCRSQVMIGLNLSTSPGYVTARHAHVSPRYGYETDSNTKAKRSEIGDAKEIFVGEHR